MPRRSPIAHAVAAEYARHVTLDQRRHLRSHGIILPDGARLVKDGERIRLYFWGGNRRGIVEVDPPPAKLAEACADWESGSVQMTRRDRVLRTRTSGSPALQP